MRQLSQTCEMLLYVAVPIIICSTGEWQCMSRNYSFMKTIGDEEDEDCAFNGHNRHLGDPHRPTCYSFVSHDFTQILDSSRLCKRREDQTTMHDW